MLLLHLPLLRPGHFGSSGVAVAAVDASVAVAGLVSVVSAVPLAAVGVAVPTAVDVVFWGVDYARSSNIIIYTKLQLLKQSKQKMIKLK